MSKGSRASRKEPAQKGVSRGKKAPQPKTPGKVIIKYDVGFNNSLYIRGKGAGLSWDKGVPLKNMGPDEWIWEPTQAFNECEFKVLINDQCYENGENHHLAGGASIQYTPFF